MGSCRIYTYICTHDELWEWRSTPIRCGRPFAQLVSKTASQSFGLASALPNRAVGPYLDLCIHMRTHRYTYSEISAYTCAYMYMHNVYIYMYIVYP